ncbi:MAG TPA: glycosyltransferase family 2 protein [bacterium]|nr:glycosyltransferase family 2 protein [bacterium]
MRRPLRRKAVIVALLLAWTAVTVHQLMLHDATWLSAIFFATGLYGTFLMAVALWSRRSSPQPPAAGDPRAVRPFVSIIVPARNEEDVIADTVRCLCALDYRDGAGRPWFEIIVVDHRSTDRTAQVLADLRREIRFTVVRPSVEDGVGKAVALNVGLAAARGEAICVFDADARVAPDFLSRLVPHLGRPGVAGVQARKLVYDGRGSLLMRAQEDDYVVFQTLTQRGRHRLGGAVILTGNGLVTKRDRLEAVGGWNEDALTEDIDLSIRYALRGWTVHYCEDVVVWEEAVPTWRGLVQQRTRWSEGSLGCLFEYAGALLRAPIPWRKRLDFLVFLSGSLVLALSMVTSYLFLAEDWLLGFGAHRLSVLNALPVAQHQPWYAYYWIIVMMSTVVGIAVERVRTPAGIVVTSARYMVFATHQVVTLPLALYRYIRSVFTGRIEWMKTEHRGLGLPVLRQPRLIEAPRAAAVGHAPKRAAEAVGATSRP